MSDDPGRNDPCPCGSGHKYKHCCQNQSPWYKSKTLMGIGLGVLVLAGVLLMGMILSNQGGSNAPECPPGQVWSEAHGHCH
mgnify:CR=1 FL=1